MGSVCVFLAAQNVNLYNQLFTSFLFLQPFSQKRQFHTCVEVWFLGSVSASSFYIQYNGRDLLPSISLRSKPGQTPARAHGHRGRKNEGDQEREGLKDIRSLVRE